MQTLNYNRDTMFYEETDLISIPKKERWSGAQIYHFINDVQKQCELTSQLNLPEEVSQHYHDLFTQLVKTYGH